MTNLLTKSKNFVLGLHFSETPLDFLEDSKEYIKDSYDFFMKQDEYPKNFVPDVPYSDLTFHEMKESLTASLEDVMSFTSIISADDINQGQKLELRNTIYVNMDEHPCVVHLFEYDEQDMRGLPKDYVMERIEEWLEEDDCLDKESCVKLQKQLFEIDDNISTWVIIERNS